MAIAHYTLEEQYAALDLTARIGITAAARELGMQRKTIGRFKGWNPEYWSDLVASPDYHPARRSRTAESLEDLADAYAAREFEAIERAAELIPDADAKGLAAIMRAMGSSRNTATAGGRAYRGEDAQVTEVNINFEALERAAQAILARVPQPQQPSIDSTLTEIPNEAS